VQELLCEKSHGGIAQLIQVVALGSELEFLSEIEGWNRVCPCSIKC